MPSALGLYTPARDTRFSSFQSNPSIFRKVAKLSRSIALSKICVLLLAGLNILKQYRLSLPAASPKILIPFVARKDAYLGTFSLSYPTKIALPCSLDSYKRSFSMQCFMISRSIPLLQRYATTLLLLSFLSGSSSFLS